MHLPAGVYNFGMRDAPLFSHPQTCIASALFFVIHPKLYESGEKHQLLDIGESIFTFIQVNLTIF
jgi:hypothetical protein